MEDRVFCRGGCDVLVMNMDTLQEDGICCGEGEKVCYRNRVCCREGGRCVFVELTTKQYSRLVPTCVSGFTRFCISGVIY